MYYIRAIMNFLCVATVVIFQTSFINSLPYPLSQFNGPLIMLLFVLVLGGEKRIYWWSVGTGVLLDTVSFYPFGIYLASFTATVFLCCFLLMNFFTNRSLYSFLALTTIATIGHALSLSLLKYLSDIITVREKIPLSVLAGSLPQIMAQLALNLSVVFLLFYFINFVSRRFKPVFLIR